MLDSPTDQIAVLESDEGRWRVYLHEAPFVEFQSRDEAMAMFKLLGG